jgi:hypothetical protein
MNDAAPETLDAKAPEPPSDATPAPAPLSPVLRSAWLLRATAMTLAIASVLGVLVAPGLPGNATGRVVDLVQQASDVFAYAAAGLLIAVIFLGAYELARAQKVSLVARVVSVGASGLVVALSAPAMRDSLHPLAAIFLALAASVTALTSAWQGIRVTHTRAAAAVIAAMGIAALVRVGAWELASAAGDRGSTRLYDFAAGIASGGVILEGMGQLAAAAWLGTRGRLLGRVLSNVAILLAFVATWGAARGVHPGAAPWQAVLHGALADAPGTPVPLGMSAIATFLVSCGILLGLVAVVQRGQIVAVLAALAFALLSRGTLDVPLRALAIAAAGHWIMLATIDDRSMWKMLIAARSRRIEQERAESAKPPAEEPAP